MSKTNIHTIIEELHGETAVALGYFDGVHLAHKAVIDAATGAGLRKTVLTFSLQNRTPENKKQNSLIFKDEQKLNMFRRLHVEEVFMPNFDEIADITPDDFFYDILQKKLHAKVISCGYDYSFGKGAAGNTARLKELCDKNGVTLHLLPEQKIEGHEISSSAIRSAIAKGDIPTANKLLGYRYNIWGKVVHGKSLGRTLGFPTINQEFLPEQILPKFGVYQSLIYLNGEYKKGITNVGIKPTIDGLRAPLAETFLLDTNEDLYGKMLCVELIRMTRPEQKFSSLEELKKTVENDIAQRKICE